MAMTLKKLGKIEKSLEAELTPEQFGEVQKTLAGVRAAMESGETFTKGDLMEILGGDVEVTAVDPVAKKGNEDEEHPVAPIMMNLYKGLFDNGSIRKGLTGQSAQELFEKAYQELADTFDVGLNAAVEATAIELGQVAGGGASGGVAAIIGKSGKGNKKPVTGEDEDCEDMEKSLTWLLKGSPAGLQLLKKMADLETTVATLQTERDTSVFAKQAADIGEPAAFGGDLAKLHRLDPELAGKISKMLSSKNELLRVAKTWGAELGGEGGNGGEGGSANDQITSLARDKVSKSEGKLTFAKAFTMVCSEQPDLYARHQEEQRAARR